MDPSSSSGNTSPSSSSPSSSATDGSDSSSSDSGDSTSGGSDSTSLTDGTTTMVIVETESSSSTVSTEPPDTSSSSTNPPDTSSGSDTGGPGGNGEPCMANGECASGFCYLEGILGGICGECLTDADCDFGCGAANPLASPPTGSTCDDGSLSSGCQTDNACQAPLVCTEVLDLPGVITLNGCSECAIDADCGGDLCSPVNDELFLEFQAHWACVGAGTLALGDSCDFDGTGDDACGSGHCGIADIMGLLQLGVCSECSLDADCGAGGTCEAPTVEIDGTVTPGTCV